MLLSAALAITALLAALCRRLASTAPKLVDFFIEGRNLKRSVGLLNLSPFTQRASIPVLGLLAFYTGLADKGIVTLTTTDARGGDMIIHITDRAWKFLKKKD
jgi:hypothetical protein